MFSVICCVELVNRNVGGNCRLTTKFKILPKNSPIRFDGRRWRGQRTEVTKGNRPSPLLLLLLRVHYCGGWRNTTPYFFQTFYYFFTCTTTSFFFFLVYPGADSLCCPSLLFFYSNNSTVKYLDNWSLVEFAMTESSHVKNSTETRDK